MHELKTKDRFLCWEDGRPFFYLGDTAWELFHRLDRNEIAHYLAQRARQGFTVIQAVALSELEGITVPNCEGRLPLHLTNGLPDPARPDTDGENSYWDLVDFTFGEAEKNGLMIALLPTWGDKINLLWGKGPVIFTEENAEIYGRWIAHRYRDRPNLLWMLGGDRPLEAPHRRIIDAMARGILSEDSHHLLTFHPPGSTDSTRFVGDAEYIDFHTAQTGHGVEWCYHPEDMMLHMAQATNKPFLDSESRYEDHPACFNASLSYYWDADDLRQTAYRDVLAGACGQTYGNHSIWSMNREPSAYFPVSWQEALTHPGAEQMGYLKQLRLSRDYFSYRFAPELLVKNEEGMGHMVAGMGKEYGYVYCPLGLPLTVNLSALPACRAVRALWFNPRTGVETVFAVLPPQGSTVLVPPTMGKGQDWVLILEAKDWD